jgi:hypothetical protein
VNRSYSEFQLFTCCRLGADDYSGFLESLCDHLYDHLRPRILHEPNLEVLCGVCTVLQALMVQDVSDYPDGDDQVFYSEDASPRSPYEYTPRGGTPTGNGHGGQDDYFGSAAMNQSYTNPSQYRSGYSSTARSPVFGKRSLSHMSLSYHRNSSYGQSSSRQSQSYAHGHLHRQGSTAQIPYDTASLLTRKGHGQYGYAHTSQGQHARPRRPLGRLHTEMLLSMVLQDAQTRLVFRAQAMLAADVQYYLPKEGDLDYPAKLALGESSYCFRSHAGLRSVLNDQAQRRSFPNRPIRPIPSRSTEMKMRPRRSLLFPRQRVRRAGTRR